MTNNDGNIAMGAGAVLFLFIIIAASTGETGTSFWLVVVICSYLILRTLRSDKPDKDRGH